MANLRVVYNNAADRASLSSSATAGSLAVANLQSDIKSKVCRSTGTSLTLTLTWAVAETINAVIMAFTNLSSTATMNVKAYTNAADSTAIYDVTNTCAQGGVSNVSGVNNFAYGAGVYARQWMTSTVVAKKLVITITDANNALGYVEAGRLIVGSYWAPSFGVEQDGTSFTMVDMSEQVRTDSGDMFVNVKPRYRKQQLSMPSLNKDDQSKMWRILWNHGTVKPIFLSLFPNNSDVELEQVHMLYGRLVSSPSLTSPYFQYRAANLDIEEI